MVNYTIEQVQEFKRIFADRLAKSIYKDEQIWYKMQLNWAENKLKELQNDQNSAQIG